MKVIVGMIQAIRTYWFSFVSIHGTVYLYSWMSQFFNCSTLSSGPSICPENINHEYIIEYTYNFDGYSYYIFNVIFILSFLFLIYKTLNFPRLFDIVIRLIIFLSLFALICIYLSLLFLNKSSNIKDSLHSYSSSLL